MVSASLRQRNISMGRPGEEARCRIAKEGEEQPATKCPFPTISSSRSAQVVLTIRKIIFALFSVRIFVIVPCFQ